MKRGREDAHTFVPLPHSKRVKHKALSSFKANEAQIQHTAHANFNTMLPQRQLSPRKRKWEDITNSVHDDQPFCFSNSNSHQQNKMSTKADRDTNTYNNNDFIQKLPKSVLLNKRIWENVIASELSKMSSDSVHVKVLRKRVVDSMLENMKPILRREFDKQV